MYIYIYTYVYINIYIYNHIDPLPSIQSALAAHHSPTAPSKSVPSKGSAAKSSFAPLPASESSILGSHHLINRCMYIYIYIYTIKYIYIYMHIYVYIMYT